jgi:hypothetical protein
LNERWNIFCLDDVTVDHVDHFEFMVMQFHCGRGTTVFDHQHVETFIRKAANGTANALIREDPGDHEVADIQVT